MTGSLIWITGRAATGKSTVVHALVDHLRSHGANPVVLSDENLLLRLKQQDTRHVHHWHPHGDERLAWRTGDLFDQSVRELSDLAVAQLEAGRLTLIELARGRRTPPIDVSYRRALDLIDPRVWARSAVFRLELDFTAQLQRNAGRHTGTGHGTPEDIMHALYSDDDPCSLTAADIVYATLPATRQPHQNAALILSAAQTMAARHNI